MIRAAAAMQVHGHGSALGAAREVVAAAADAQALRQGGAELVLLIALVGCHVGLRPLLPLLQVGP